MKHFEVQAIIGPQQSIQASFVIDLGEKSQVPVLSFSATSPFLSPLKSPYFVRTTIDDSTQVKAIAAIIQNFEWKEVVLIYEDTDYGNGVIPYFIDAFQEIDIRVPYRSAIPLDATDDQILEVLHNLTTMQTRVFIVHMSSSLGSRLFINAENARMMSQGFAWIVTDGLSSLLAPIDSNAVDSMEGVLGVRPYIPKSKELEEFKVKWKRRFYSNKSYSEISDPTLYGIWAYDTVWALAMAVEQVGTLNPQFLSGNTTNNLTDISSLGYSPIGPQLLHSILSTRFKGLSGDFRLVNGQLESSTFQIFNVIREGERVIGYWTPTRGISRQLNPTNKFTNLNSMSSLKSILWPGDSAIIPMGWDVLINGKEILQILVPSKDGFKQFVDVERDPFTKKIIHITAFSLGDYNLLIDEVYNKRFNAAVGDVSILANRSNYVDFTMPYTESGVTMVVPMKDNLEKEFWMFVKPLSPGLWLVTSAGFIYIGVVVWILEQPTNTELGASLRERLETSLWYSFLTLIFAQRERIENNLTRVVLITWVFFILILTQSYTASLSSTLTTRQLQPTITDVSDIKNNGYYVGYQGGSFVRDFLRDHLHLDESKFRNYSTPEEFHYALSNGTDRGGVAAILVEIPFVQVFLNMYCNKYTTAGRTYASEGFGFIFPKGSPLVSYVSREILNITDDGTLNEIKKKWLGDHTKCNIADASSTSTNQLTLRSFGGLFLIIGVVSGLSLLIHLFLFVYGSWHVQSTRMPLSLSWKNSKHAMKSQPKAGEDIEQGTVDEEVGATELQTMSAEHKEEPTVEGGIVEGGIVKEEEIVSGLRDSRCGKTLWYIRSSGLYRKNINRIVFPNTFH
ncbi:glutamate receptor 2.8-like [Macadamia integrifolia]|uniref:glutamate receptor 2.8-like n=1 Tax=Macadamia integrifolia TaxID=60698 RepID=UPI001C4F6ECF|nr:glutamate receptor 2.8-like [Macadamia integrifolia]